MRRNYYSGKYALDKHEYLHAKYFALRYNKWRDEYEALADPAAGIRYDKERVQTSGDYDSTAANGERRAELAKKIGLVEQTAMEADRELCQWIIKGVTEDFATYRYLKYTLNMPCGKDMYYNRKRKFYFLLAQKI